MQHGQGQTAQSSGVDSEANEANPSPLPLQGSFAAVYDIASLLLRQCVQLRLFDGGLLAVESVTNYSKERVAQQEKKANAWTRNDAQNPQQGVFQSSFKYDKVSQRVSRDCCFDHILTPLCVLLFLPDQLCVRL